MELETPRAWLRIQLEVRVDGTLVVGASDDTGRSIAPLRTVTAAFGWPPPTLISLPGIGEMVPARWPAELGTMLGEAAERLARRQRSDQLLPSVPVFVDSPPSLGLGARPAVESMLRVIRPELAARWIVTATPPEQAVHSGVTPFSLPLDVVGVGELGAEVLSSLKAPWFGPEAEVQSFRASAAWVETPAEAAARLTQGDVDIVVLGASETEAMAAAMAGRGAPVRLAIVLGVGSGGVLDTLLTPVLWARSVIFVPGPADQDQVRAVGDVFAGLSHDLPLHDVVAGIRRQHPSRAAAQLVATPESVHDLRLTSAWEAVEGELAELAGVVGTGSELDYGAVLVDLPERQRDLAAELVRGVTSARGTLLAFRRETEGLNPLSQMRSDLQSARVALDQLRSQQVPDEARATEPRVVNLGLRRREGVLAAPYTDSFYIDRNRTLAAGGRYTLDVQIGAPWEHSLVADDPRRAELHLPGGRAGSEVEIVVFAEEGLVEGRDSETVLVPRHGPTRVVSFDITAPLQAGGAWLRVGVYHRGSLLQTLRLDLVVTVEEESRNEPVSVARLDHSATRDWGNLRAVGPRALSLVLNSGSDGGHHLSIHGAGIKTTVPVGRAASTDAVKKLRQILVQTVAPGADAADIVWQLASVGEELRLWVAGRLGDCDAELLRRMAGTRDETVQVVRIDPDQAFPWTLLYDWNLPEQLVGAPRPEVCFGTNDAGEDCGHQAGAEVVCVHGFWGIRHRVEEMLGETERRDIAEPVRLGDPGVLVALGVSDAATTQLRTSLDTMLLPNKVRELKETEGLLDSLFNADRPAVVVVVGHNETRTLPGQPEGPRILVTTSDHWFHGKSLDRRWNQLGPWSPPHSLVMLLSCGSAAPQATELTSYLSALRKVSAGAVIGTQCDVRTVIAVDFALGVLGLMTDAAAPQPLADAVRQTRRRVVIDGKDPRGFLFDAYGPAEFTLAAT